MATIELDLSELHDRTSEDLYRAVQDDGLIRSGTYSVQVDKFFARANAMDSDFNPGREFASLFCRLYDPADLTKSLGTTYVKVSWDERRTKAGKPDAQSSLWGQLQKALGLDAAATVPDVLTASTRQRVHMTFEETYRVAPVDVHDMHKGQIRDATASEIWVRIGAAEDEERNHYRDLGYEALTQCRRIRK
jgi:hypothetical protein